MPRPILLLVILAILSASTNAEDSHFAEPQRERAAGVVVAAPKAKEKGDAPTDAKPKAREDDPKASPSKTLVSSLVRLADGVPTRGPWGEWRRYFRGPTPTMNDLVVLAVTLKPGEEPHPPHRHAEEEIILLAEGSGVWHLEGRELAAQKGDAIYTGPQTMHGIKNTGSVPLTYYMIKWNGKVAGQQPEERPAAKDAAPANKSAVIRDEVPGSINHSKGSTWNRIIGKVMVLDANHIEFADGTRIELDITVPARAQMAMNSEGLYPCGQAAAEFLRGFIGDKTLMCFKNDDGPSMAYVGNDNLERVMVVYGWALADHSSLHADEIIAREQKRGLWQGKFIHPDTWRAGVRLPGEMPPPKLKTSDEAERLIWNFGTDEDALPQIIARVTTETPELRKVRFHRGGAITDDGLEQLGKLKQLEVLDLSGCWSLSNPGLARLKAFPLLRELSLPHTISDKGLEPLESLPELEYLMIDPWRGDPVTDAGLVHLQKLGKLRHLVVNQPQVTDAGVPHLAVLASLKILEFGGLPLTDACLDHLAKLENLEYLDISGTEVADKGMPRLAGLKRLRVLKLPDRVTEKARQEMQRALPELKFEGDVPK